MTLQFQPRVLSSRTVREWHVIVRDIVEEMDILLVQHQPSRDRVYGCVSPSFIKETTILVERSEEIDICLGP